MWATAKSDGVVRIHADVEVRTSDEVGGQLYHRAGVQGLGTLGLLWRPSLKRIWDVRRGYSGILWTFDFEDTVIGRTTVPWLVCTSGTAAGTSFRLPTPTR